MQIGFAIFLTQLHCAGALYPIDPDLHPYKGCQISDLAYVDPDPCQ